MTTHATHQLPLRTLALDPGTREMGYAVLEGTTLLRFGVHTFAYRQSAQRLLAEGQRFVRKLLEDYAPQVFVIEKTFYAKSKRSAVLHVFVEEMQRFAKRQGLTVRAYAPTTVKKAIGGHGAATKRMVAEALVAQYPHLAKYLRIDRRNSEQYWQNMFDALAVGLTGYAEVSKRATHKEERPPPWREPL